MGAVMNKIKQFIEEEDYNLKLKLKVDFGNPKEYLEEIIEIANSRSVGYIVFGVDYKNNKIGGINRVKKSYQEIIKNIKNHIKPDMKLIIKLVHIEGKNIILLKIVPEKGKCFQYVE